MGLGEVLLHGVEYTIIGMGTVFSVLIFISFCIMLMGKTLKSIEARKAAKAAAKAAPAEEAKAAESTEAAPAEDNGLAPEIVAAIMAALQMKFDGEIGEGGYRLRNIRRAEWRHM